MGRLDEHKINIGFLAGIIRFVLRKDQDNVECVAPQRREERKVCYEKDLNCFGCTFVYCTGMGGY
jgi:hypothetical protein